MNSPLRMRIVDARQQDVSAQLREIRDQLSPRGDVVTPRGKELTQQVFGSPLTPQQVVEKICGDVARHGRSALLDYTYKLDHAEVRDDTLRVSMEEMREAHRRADLDFLNTVRRIRQNILTFQIAILHQNAVMPMVDHELRLIYRPIDRVGICVPGGAAAYPSTLLMTAIPAQAAGVKEIAVMAPPTPYGANNPDLQAVCFELGVSELYRMGGAQGVAALAYGVEGIPKVDKIVGPGSLFVALAKQHVSDVCGIDMIAGPTEVVIIADESAKPAFLAADLLSQAEHAPGASILITTCPAHVADTVSELEKQLEKIDRSGQARQSLEAFGAIILVASEAEACRLSNDIAPEHLELATSNPENTLLKIDHAGAVFMGHYTPVAVGDYVAGPSHTLPTGGTARFSSGLASNDFLKRTSVIAYTPAKLNAVADDLRVMAKKEGLTAHSDSVDIRLSADRN